MQNRTSFYIVVGIIFLAVIGIISQLVNNPGAILRMILITAGIVTLIYFLIKRFSKASPTQKHEQRAFNKAAKRSKKRFQTNESSPLPKRPTLGSLSQARKKKKDSPHLTVIEGKKGKKKNRASF